MIKKKVKDWEISLFGLDLSKLPGMTGVPNADEKKMTEEMIDYAMKKGVNYYDIGESAFNEEALTFLGTVLSKYPRESFYLAGKFNSIDMKYSGKAEEILEMQLKACQVECFDFYSAEQVDDAGIDFFLDESYEDMSYFIRQRKVGRLKAIGFLAFGGAENIERFMQAYGEWIEFCQLSVNYYELRKYESKRKIDILKDLGIPMWIVDPLMGGKLCQMPEEYMSVLRMLRRDETAVGWGLKFAMSLPRVSVVIDGSADMEVFKEEISVFEDAKMLGVKDITILYSLADDMIECDN